MKNRRIFAALLGLSLLIAAFAGCSAGNGSTTESTAPTSGTTATTTTEATTTAKPSETTTETTAATTTETTTEATTETTTESTSESSATESQEPSGELDAIMQDIIDNATSKLQYIKDMTLLVTEIKDDAKEYYFGSADVEMAEGLALEPEISSPFSVCLVKVPDGVDAESVRDQIKETVNPMKWVCMGVDPSKVIVEVEGDIVILIMTDNGGPEIYEAFKASVG
jgi:hypothetical protein